MDGIPAKARAVASVPLDAGESSPQWQQINVAALVALLRRRKWTVLATVACVMATALLITSQLTRLYTATTLVVVDSRDSQLLGFQPGVSVAESTVSSLVDTEVAIAQSNDVLARVAANLDLANAPDFAEHEPLVEVLRTLVGLGKVDPRGPSKQFVNLDPLDQGRVVETLAQVVSIARLGLTSVISMSATASTPELASDMANGLANAYLAVQLEARLNSNERATRFLRGRVDELATTIADNEQHIDDFVAAKLAELSSPEARTLLTTLVNERKQRDAAFAAMSGIRDALEAQDNARLAKLVESQSAGIAAEREALVNQIAALTDQTALAAAKVRLNDLDIRIRSLASSQANDLQLQIEDSNTRSAGLRNQISTLVSDLALPREITNELANMQRDLETNRALYDSFLTKLRQISQQSDFNIPDSRIIAAATPPTEPSFPPTTLILIGSVFFALLAGLGLAFLRENFIGGVTSVEQLETLAGVPVLAGVPRYSSRVASSRPDLAIVSDPLSVVAEALRRIQVGIDAFAPQDKRVIMVSSSLPGEGKTTVGLGLARQMVAAGNRTLFIDADLRHPTAHRYIGHQVEEGIIDYLVHRPEGGLEQIAVVREEASGVDFVLGKEGSTVATDALLMSRRFEELMEFARDHYDVVIIDTPPAGLVVDAALVARHCDLGVFITRYASTGQHQVRGALRDLYRTNLPLYCVLNQIQKAESYRDGAYGGRYRHYYGLKSR